MVADHGWRGDGRFRLAKLDGKLLMRFAGISTKRTRLNAEMGAFFRKHYRGLRPRFGDFAVAIYVECVKPSRRIDADTVAKACLDSLTGIVWKDDSQVVRLTVDKIAAETDAVTVVIEKAGASAAPAELAALIAAADGLR